jgi:membrane protein DedA with SNARE-associated domain
MENNPEMVAAAPPESAKKFTWKHALALLFAAGISAVLIIYRDQFAALQNWGYLGAFLLMLLTNATLILPAPGLVLVFTLGATLPNPLLVGLAAGLGSTLGELTGYLAGFSGSGVIENTDTYRNVEKTLRKYDVWAIAFLAFIPNPLFDIAGIVAGALGMQWWKFLTATGIGKTLKTIIVAYAGALSLTWIQPLLK